MTSRTIIAANRGPISFTERADGAVAPVIDAAWESSFGSTDGDVTFVSVAATPSDRSVVKQGRLTDGLPDGVAARLITPSRRALHRYYNVICNPLLWFLHHRSWGITHTPNIDREAHAAWEQGFVTVSQMFADQIASEAAHTDELAKVQLHDYHLHLVAGMAREKLPDASITYAPSVPWPGSTDWMALPARWRESIFSSLMACDEIELASQRDLRNLLSCIEEFVPAVTTDRQMRQATDGNGHCLQLTVSYPTIGAETLQATADSRRCTTFISRFEKDPRHTFVTADRTEPYKNIVRCIRAFGALLDSDRSLAEDARYLLVLAPPPPHLAQYRRYLSEIEKAAKDVNGRHRARSGPPVELIVESNYPMALAAMCTADALVSTPVVDASCSTPLSTALVNRNDCDLILSETSTAAEIFGDAATLVAATDVEAIKTAMLDSIEMSDDERAQRFDRVEAAAIAR